MKKLVKMDESNEILKGEEMKKLDATIIQIYE